MEKQFPTIVKVKTGKQIRHLMDSLGLTVMDVQKYMGLATPVSYTHLDVYKRQILIMAIEYHLENIFMLIQI